MGGLVASLLHLRRTGSTVWTGEGHALEAGLVPIAVLALCAAVALVLLFGYGWVVLVWDYSMTMSLHFQQTMYSWQVFMGGWLVMLMSVSWLTRAWRNHLGAHDLITESHFHDIGKLCFAFTAFWGYLTFSQFLVIWYGNLP